MWALLWSIDLNSARVSMPRLQTNGVSTNGVSTNSSIINSTIVCLLLLRMMAIIQLTWLRTNGVSTIVAKQ